MSQTIPDITLNSTSFTDINTQSGISVGTAMIIQNKGTSNIVIQESVLQPDPTSEDGLIMTNIFSPYSRADISAGSIRIWARVLGGASCKINVQIG